MNLFQLVLKQMRQRALSTWLTLLSVILGSALATSVMILRRESAGLFTQSDFGYDLIVGAKGSPMQLVLNTVYHIDKSPGNIPYIVYEALRNNLAVKTAVPFAIGDSYKGYRVTGTTPEMFGFDSNTGKPLPGYDDKGRLLQGYNSPEIPQEERDPAKPVAASAFNVRYKDKFTLADGRMFHPRKFEAVLGSEIPDRTGLKLGDKFKVAHNPVPGRESPDDEHAEEWTVVGVLNKTRTAEDRAIFIPLVSFYSIPQHEWNMDLQSAMQRGEDLTRFDKAPSATQRAVTIAPTTAAAKREDHGHDHDHDHDNKPVAKPATKKDDHGHDHDHDHDADHKHDHAHKPATAAAATKPATAPASSTKPAPAHKHEDHNHDPAHADDHKHDSASKPGVADRAAAALAGGAPKEDHDHDHDHADHKHEKPATTRATASTTTRSAAHKDDDHDHGHGHEGHDHPQFYSLNADGTINLMLPKDRWQVSGVLVRTKGGAANMGLQYTFQNSPMAGAVNPAGVMRDFFGTFLGPTTLVLLLIALMVVLTAGVSILVSIYNAVSARSREIAIMRALGATRGKVLTLICVEAGLIGLVGAVLGLIIGHGIGAIESAYFVERLGVGINWLAPGPEEWVYLAAVVVLSVLAGLVPGLKAYRTPVATNLVAA